VNNVMILKFKLKQDFFFFSAYFLFIMQTMLSRSMFYYDGIIPGAFFTTIRILVVLLSTCKIVVFDKFSLRRLLIYGLVLSSVLISFLESERSIFL